MNGYHPDPNRSQIIEVWAHNLEEEFSRIRDVVEFFHYIAIDTEFPGIVTRPNSNSLEYNYQTVKLNVDLLKVIQLGITFADSHGNLASGTSTWQFNFVFDLENDKYAKDSIQFLKDSGIDFEEQGKKGITFRDFGELIVSSGLVMNEDVKWISFHGCYDFGYLLKLLTCAPLPQHEAQFFELLHDFFPALYDIKYLLMNIRKLNFNGGQSLQKIADHLNVTRIGRQHQAGSDSLVTCRTFFRLMESYFDNQIDDSKFSGIIYGLGSPGRSSRSAHLDMVNGLSSNSNSQNMFNQSSNTLMSSPGQTVDENSSYYISSMDLNPYNRIQPAVTNNIFPGHHLQSSYSSSQSLGFHNSIPHSNHLGQHFAPNMQHISNLQINSNLQVSSSSLLTSGLPITPNTIPEPNTALSSSMLFPLAPHSINYPTHQSNSNYFSYTSSLQSSNYYSSTNTPPSNDINNNSQGSYLNHVLPPKVNYNRDLALHTFSSSTDNPIRSHSPFSINNSTRKLPSSQGINYTTTERTEQSSLHRTQDRICVYEGPPQGT